MARGPMPSCCGLRHHDRGCRRHRLRVGNFGAVRRLRRGGYVELRCRRFRRTRRAVQAPQAAAAPSPSLAGQRAADAVARFGGSWTFVALFAAMMFAWVALNAYLLASRGKTFDPYPYVLLNLFLSMLAAIQAPVILMSQNRQSEKDRISAEHDYEVNLKAELEIMLLHENARE
jgi:uncharacterized membrane protein